MSIILKGIDMPTTDGEINALCVYIFPSGNVQVEEWGNGCKDGYSLGKSAIQIPKDHCGYCYLLESEEE